MATISTPPLPPTTSTCHSVIVTDEDTMQYEIYGIILENMEPNGVDISFCFERASSLPPITAASLAELDVPRIINNPKLRHDVNFDRELHFRPNLDGSKGRQKMESADHYWQALEGEFFMYGYASQQKQQAQDPRDEAHWTRVLAASQKRLPKIFEAIRDILKTLVPDYEQRTVIERLDVDLIMQEISNGVCDLISLSNWLAKVLKAHCAPMRDGLVDGMQEDIEAGALGNKPEKLVDGLRQLLSILEAMKLDVANHQIRHMRPLLIDDTVNFGRRYNAHRIVVGKIHVHKSQLWLDQEIESLTTEQYIPTHLEALGSALLRDVLFNENNPCPSTFYLDGDRLRCLRLDMRSSICYEVCRDILADLTPVWVSKAELLKAQAALHVSVSAIVGMSGRFTERIENIAVDIVRIMLMLEGRYPPFDTSILGLVEQRLATALEPASAAFDKIARDTCDRLLPKLKTSVEEHMRLSALDLQDALVSPTPSYLPPPAGIGAMLAPYGPPKPYDPDEDVIRRLTQVICLHWHVWADLVYLAPRKPMLDTAGLSYGAAPPPGSASPTVPIAQAVYAPGKKWLPVGVTVTEIPSVMPTPASSPKPVQEHAQPNATEQSESPHEQETLDAP
ncbi:hypothetical protein LTR08_003393 [Meristemomyces frigidus]|nr:hypothetical protein LTR08_003393 [Meristemomyces frigidus]